MIKFKFEINIILFYYIILSILYDCSQSSNNPNPIKSIICYIIITYATKKIIQELTNQFI